MKLIRKLFARRRPALRPHMGPWQPVSYQIVAMHIAEATPR